MSAFFKNCAPLVLLVCAFYACAPSSRGPLPHVPLAAGTPFPNIPHDDQAGGYALKCMHGYYAEQQIEKSDLQRTHGNELRPNPAGKGKIHTRYAKWWDGYVAGEYWGYTFTIHTRDDGVITNCSATQQLLKK